MLAAGIWELNSQNMITFVLVDASGTEVAGLGNTFNVLISKAGAAFDPSAGTKAEIGNGWYSYLSTAGEADTPGPVAIYITGAGIVQQNLEYVVERRAVNAIEFTYTVTDSSTGLPIEGVEVWITTDLARNRVVWYGVTDTFGVAREENGDLPFLDPGTYYFWRQRAGYTFADPDTEVVS